MRNSRKEKIDKEMIKSLLAIKGKTIQQMCAEIYDRYGGIAPITLSDCIKKESIMPQDLDLIAQYLNVHPNKLLTEKRPDSLYEFNESIGKRTDFNDYHKADIRKKLKKERKKLATEMLDWLRKRYPGFIDNSDPACKEFIVRELEDGPLFDMIEESVEAAYMKFLIYQKTGEYPDSRFEHSAFEQKYQPE